ncbi:MAG: DUF1295 domain-containing protein [Bacteroidia bacterium]|nr:DUF1295 domain-containing protein [Bacteroidia bacterium]
MMEPLMSVILVSFAAVSLIMVITWLVALQINNFSIVDVVWSFNFFVIAAIIWFMSEVRLPRLEIICALLTLWSVRLTLYLGIRVGSHLQEEEGRYKQLRMEWVKNLNSKFFWFYQMQAVSNLFLCIPFFIMAFNNDNQLNFLEYIGSLIWITGIVGEAIADYQLQQFKKNKWNKGKVCQTGLWNYSRHPNYFFQLTIWTGVFIFALSSNWGWLSIVCPLSIGWLLFKVTGIPLTEQQSLRSKGDAYRKYQSTTSIFFPMPKKN